MRPPCLRWLLRPVAGYAMASLRQQSAALVAGGSSRFSYQIDRVAEHLGVTIFKLVAGTLHCSVFSPHWQSHLFLMNGRVGRRRSCPLLLTQGNESEEVAEHGHMTPENSATVILWKQCSLIENKRACVENIEKLSANHSAWSQVNTVKKMNMYAWSTIGCSPVRERPLLQLHN